MSEAANEEPRQVVGPKEAPKQLTDKDGLDKASGANTDISVRDNLFNIVGRKYDDRAIGRLLGQRFHHYGMLFHSANNMSP